ncbi:hypothetical protein ACELLULO517_16010 [Acidisoma cellulosilytica]|uniref:Uncharacterized protein n=1 Tax=Acidisoma cellulosilyticum TaxID=2802395 RepID=A0A963Z3D9_9PROT|nr:hypothetical protein [Acidisoma cellulosilyticum]MCB8881754.1 hypothetical protein [Acidisoma cellulosilyticum]
MSKALSQGASPILAVPFDDIGSLIEKRARLEIDLIVLHAQTMGDQLPQDIAALRAADLKQPIILVTGDEAGDQMANVKNSLRLGASGHLSRQSTGIDLAISSFAFAHQGGTFAPINLLLADGPDTRKSLPVRQGEPSQERVMPEASLTGNAMSGRHPLVGSDGNTRRGAARVGAGRPALRLASSATGTEDKA